MNFQARCMTVKDWHYVLTRDALIERIGGHTRIYGRWDRLFGCWEVGSNDSAWREVIFDWPLLDGDGIWLSPTEIRGPVGHPAHATWRFEAQAAYAAYFSIIPTRVRLLVAPVGRWQWKTLSRIAVDVEHARALDAYSRDPSPGFDLPDAADLGGFLL